MKSGWCSNAAAVAEMAPTNSAIEIASRTLCGTLSNFPAIMPLLKTRPMLNVEPILLLFSCCFHEGTEEVLGMRPAAPHVLGMPLHAHDETLAGHLYAFDNPVVG